MTRESHWELFDRKDGRIGVRLRGANGEKMLPGGYRRPADARHAIGMANSTTEIVDLRKKKTAVRKKA